MVKKVLEYIVKVYSQKGKTQTNLLVLNLENIRVNHRVMTFDRKNIYVKRLELSMPKLIFFCFSSVKSANLSNLQKSKPTVIRFFF